MSKPPTPTHSYPIPGTSCAWLTRRRFVNDLGRWRSLLAPDEHPLFDKIALSLWLSVGLSDPTPERAEKDGLSRFQELMQDLVIPEPHPRAAVHPAPYATPLGAIQREHASKEEQAGAPASGAVSIPIPSGGARKRVYDEALDADGDGDGDGFSISDVFDVERFLARSVGDESEGGGAPDLAWNDILSTTALILASTAFSVFLTLTTGTFLHFLASFPPSPCEWVDTRRFGLR